MAAKLNTEFNYRYQVIGETPWEKIKTLKGFLEGRVRAAALEEVSDMKLKAKKLEVQYCRDIGALAHVILLAEAELKEAESFQATQDDAFALNRQEIAILERLLAEYYAEAEPTRIPGYTDEQMFEVNAANEFTAMIAKDIYAEIVATGRPSPAKLRNAMSNPHTWEALKRAGLIPEDTKMLLTSTDPRQIEVRMSDELPRLKVA